ncbi:MAG: hypothetical protein JRF02_08025 [Deltaproteobacteria bacterium]|jgi:cystathionine beta-lyase|nr:hypothetical protein [Deltaproteobacteria bacterium]
MKDFDFDALTERRHTASLKWERYGDRDIFLYGLLDYLRLNSRLVEQEINSLEGLAMKHVEATYLAWIDARKIDGISPGPFF